MRHEVVGGAKSQFLKGSIVGSAPFLDNTDYGIVNRFRCDPIRNGLRPRKPFDID
jgi:hypothetical protein